MCSTLKNKKNSKLDLYPQGAYDHIRETKLLMSMKQLNFNMSM